MGQKEPANIRSKYVDHSHRFAHWVNQLGIEKTWVGRVANYLERRYHLRWLIILFFFCLGVSFLVQFDFEWVSRSYHVGDIAATDIKSPLSFDMMDEIATSGKRLEAEESVPLIYDLDLTAYDEVSNQVYRAFREMRRLLGNKPWPNNPDLRAEVIKDFNQYKPKFEEQLGKTSISEKTFDWLTEQRFSARIENIILRLLNQAASKKIVADLKPLIESGQDSVLMRVVTKRGVGRESKIAVNDLTDLLTFRNELINTDTKLIGVVAPEILQNATRFAQELLTANLTLNKSETAGRRQKARDAVLPVKISVQKNQVLVGAGNPIQATHVAVLEKIKSVKSNQRKDLKALFLSLLLLTLIAVCGSYLRRFTQQKVFLANKDLVAMGFITLLCVAVTKLFLFMITATFGEKLGFVVPESVFLYATPAAAGTILVGLIISRGEVVWLYSLFLSVVLSASADFDFGFFMLTLVGGVAGARGVFSCKKRNDIYYAGLRVGIINTILILVILSVKTQDIKILPNLLAWNLPAVFLSGIFSSFFAMICIPFIEGIFNYTTDIKLLELSSLNHPLLKEMIVQAPGTYHHSLIVGSMCEAAAEAIGANPLLAKVSSYYHDIGKTEHSGYFIENQKPGNNPHDHISPTMSKTVLVAHVKDGVELGMKYKLGKPIIDIIVQHHGTTLISYFYNKAKTKSGEAFSGLPEEEFRYPGPKPQSKEAALCMLADSIEAAARSLDEPTPTRLHNIVKNIIQRKFEDGQMDECNLSLNDLRVIEEVFTRTLITIYHQRIDYPKAAGGAASEAPVIKITGGWHK